MERYEQGALGERIAAKDFSPNWNVSKADPYYGDLRLEHKITGEVKHVEVKTISTPRVTVRKNGSQHLIHADYVLIYNICNGEKYLIPSSAIGTSKQRLYLSPTSQYGKYQVNKVTL